MTFGCGLDVNVVVAPRECGRVLYEDIDVIVPISRMTSPAITKSPDKQKAENKSPSHSEQNGHQTKPPEQPPTSDPQQPDPFSWLRIFKLADLMMKQGC